MGGVCFLIAASSIFAHDVLVLTRRLPAGAETRQRETTQPERARGRQETERSTSATRSNNVLIVHASLFENLIMWLKKLWCSPPPPPPLPPCWFQGNGKHLHSLVKGYNRRTQIVSWVGKGLHETKSYYHGKVRQRSLSTITVVKGHVSWWHRVRVYIHMSP